LDTTAEQPIATVIVIIPTKRSGPLRKFHGVPFTSACLTSPIAFVSECARGQLRVLKIVRLPATPRYLMSTSTVRFPLVSTIKDESVRLDDRRRPDVLALVQNEGQDDRASAAEDAFGVSQISRDRPPLAVPFSPTGSSLIR